MVQPTNDLDVEVLRSLEEALLNFAGCAVVVSHDRYFLDRVATHILACEGDSNWFYFPGNYAEYESNTRREGLEETYAPLVNARTDLFCLVSNHQEILEVLLRFGAHFIPACLLRWPNRNLGVLWTAESSAAIAYCWLSVVRH